MGIILLLAVWMGFTAWGVNVARKRGREPVLWGVLSFAFGVFAILLLYIMPTKASA